jgi:hypothetical protein
MDSQEREEVLADKNAKIAQVIAENNNLRNQVDNHTCPPCPLTHLPEPHECPIINKAEYSHSDYEELKKQLSQKENEISEQTQREIIQRLNNTFKLGLKSDEKDLNKLISKIQALIDKPPLIAEDEIIKQELQKAQAIISKLEKELSKKTLGENIKEIIKIDEKLLREHEDLKIELSKKVNGYQELAEERNKLVLQEIKNINIEKMTQIIPNKSQQIKQSFAKANNYEELSQERNKIIVEFIDNQQQWNSSVQTSSIKKQERIILVGLLVVSLVGIRGLLMKLK